MTSRVAARWVFFLVVVCGPGAAGQVWLGAPVYVQNATDEARVQEPVASGLCFPAGNNYIDPNLDFELVDGNGNSVPVQFKVLSRWWGPRDDASFATKWALIEFLADVPAAGTSVYFLRQGARAQGNLSFQTLPGEIVVNTGVAEFSVDTTQFTLLKDVQVGGVSVMGGPGGLVVHDVNGTSIDSVLTETVWEEQGSVRAVLRQKGSIGSLGLNFTVRYTFWTDRTDVKVDFRLENNNANGELPYLGSSIGHAWFEDLSLVLHGTDVGADVQLADGVRNTNGGAWDLEQDYTSPNDALHMLTGFQVREFGPGINTTQQDARADGTVALRGSVSSFAVSVDRFWQNFPKGFSASGDMLAVDLWPAFGNGPEFGGQWGLPTSPVTDPLSLDYYRFEGGRWKTVTLNLDFRQGVFSAAELTHRAKALDKPLMALWSPEYYSKSFAFGTLLAERRNWNKVSNNRYERMLDVLARDDAADNQPSLGQIGLPGFRERGGTYGGRQMYGWENFGDLAWGDGFCSNHYDLVWGVLINYPRTADYAFFDIGRDLVSHRRDYDQNHTQDPSAQRRGGQYYEKGYWHGNYGAPAPSHTWVHGLLVWYVLTGDEGAYEAAKEVGEFVARMHPESWDGWWGSRIPGWQIEVLLNLYLYLGESTYLSTAQQAMGNYEQKEQASGGAGYVLNPGWTSNPHAQTWMHCIMFNTLGKYHLMTGDPSVLPLMGRMADWIVNQVVLEVPTGPPSARTTGKVWGRYAPGWHQDPSVHHQWVTIESLSYAALCLHDNSYMMLARSLWESVTRYHQESPNNGSPHDYNDASSFSPIAFRMMQYPNAETKVMSNVALWGQVFMAADAIWDNIF